MKQKIIKLQNVVLYCDTNCPFCVAQVKLLHNYAKSKKIKIDVKYYDLSKKNAPKIIMDSKGRVSTPTWVFNNKEVNRGVIKPELLLRKALMNIKKMKFGNVLGSPEFGVLQKYGKNFPNGEKFNIPNSWSQELKKKWGDDYLVSGTLGRELGPGNTLKILSTTYGNDIRGRIPGGDLDTTQRNNMNCNLINGGQNSKSYGLYPDSLNQKTVPTNNFGGKKKKSRFGSNPAKAYDYSSLLTNEYSGGKQGTVTRGNSVKNSKYFIGNGIDYNPVKLNFGTSGNRRKPGEGTVITLNKNKISYS